MKTNTRLFFVITIFIFCARTVSFSQCSNFETEHFDSFEYSTTCPYIVPNTTYQTTPQLSPTFGPSHTGSRHIYLNFQDNYTGAAFDRPYDVCAGGTYRISFYHRDAWGGTNNTTFNIYDANNVLLASETVNWNGTVWNNWVSPELTATTNILRLEIVNNLVNQGNNDMVIDDLSLEMCKISEHRVLLTCDLQGAGNLFDLFSAAMPVTGTWSGPGSLSGGYLGTYDPATIAEGLYTYSVNDPSGCVTTEGTVSVTGGQVLELGNDITACNTQAITLDAGSGYDFYSWSNNASTQTITVSTSGTYHVTTGNLGGNLVLNGDFEGGTTAASNNFTSSYVPGTGGTWGLLSNPGQYAISTTPSSTHSNFYFCQDHTSGSGNMYVANGASISNTTVWTQTINVTPNQNYLFSFWAMNVTNDPNVSQLQLFVNGQPIGPANTTQITPCQWTQINDSWNSGTATQAVLSIVNQSTAEGGNDFALDDIVFAPFCEFTDSITVTFANPALQLTNNLTICEGNTATLIATASSATSTNFTYTWTPAMGTTGTQIVNPAATTTYSVYATGDDGCVTPTKSVTVTVSIQPTPNAGNDQVVCLGSPIVLAGTVANVQHSKFWSHNLAGVPVTPTLSYAPNTTSLNTTVTTNQPGVYLFILTEQNTGCGVFKDTVEVLVSQAAHTINMTPLTCYGNGSGSIEIINPDGVNYSFDNGVTWETNSIKSNLAAGNYTVWSENQYGCRASTAVTVTQPNPLDITASNDTTICENGTATVSATLTGVNTAIYHWMHTTDLNGSQQVSPQTQTTYSVFGENENGCMSDTVSIVVTLFNPLSGNSSPTATICPGYPTTIGVSGITGGIAPYAIVWSSGETGVGTSMNISANPPQTQIYTVTITDVCESTPLILTTEVIVSPLPVPSFTAPIVEMCEPAVFVLNSTTDPNTVQSNSWFISDGQFYSNQETITTESMPAGTYSVQLVVISPEGCIDSVTYQNYLTVHPLPVADFNWNPNPIRMFNTEVHFGNLSTNASSYEWIFEAGDILTSYEEEPKVVFPEGITGEYDVTLIAISAFGCRDTLSKVVTILPEVLLFVPNTFTPDGDEYNNQWNLHIEGIDIYNFTVEIYNRWGQRIWESQDPSVGWDGVYNGNMVQNGTYTWIISAKDRISDQKYTWNGHVNVLR